MYSELDLYYLEQLGIRPWIAKTSSLNLKKNIPEIQTSLYKLVVLITSNCNAKERVLFKRMLDFLVVDAEDMLVLNLEENSWESCSNQITHSNPQAILALGLEEQNALGSLNLNCPIFTSDAPGYFINHPLEKKKAFKALDSVNKILQ